MLMPSLLFRRRRPEIAPTAERCARLFRYLLVATLATLAIPAVRPMAETATHLPHYLPLLQVSDVFPGADRIGPVLGDPPAAKVYQGDRELGYIFLNSDVASSVGYSGKPISIVVGIDLGGTLVGAKLVEHHEPIVLIGIPLPRVTNFIDGYIGLNILDQKSVSGAQSRVDIVSGATVTMLVIGDSIIQSALRIAESRGIGGAGPVAAPAPASLRKIDESKSSIEGWIPLLGDGSVRRLVLSVADVNKAYAASNNPLAAEHPEAGPDDDIFIEMYVALATVPTIGRSLLGEALYRQMLERLKPGQQAIVIAGNGRYSFKGSGYVRGGIFDRIELVQDQTTIRFHDRNHQRLGDIAADGAPRFRDVDLFIVPDDVTLNPAAPWRLKLLVQRAIGARDKAFLSFDLSYALPDRYLTAPAAGAPAKTAAAPIPAKTNAATAPAEGSLAELLTSARSQTPPLWMRIWRARIADIAVLCLALVVVTAIFFFQDFLVRRPVLYTRVRLGFLAFTILWLGWYAQAQISVVNVLTFANALRTDFRWEYFLRDPLIFVVWFSVAAALLFWGRGAFCGWLCPFGALQELAAKLAQWLQIPQVRVPFGLHQRLWPIKYVIFMFLFALSLYSLSMSEEAAEVEPFKTAIVLHFDRDWPFMIFAALMVLVSLSIERFFCRYLCPLGAALAIPARMRMFDWLKRYKECGNPCQRCANECPVQAIHPEGNINPNECIQCLNCQVLYYHAQKCPVVIQKRLKAAKRATMASPTMRTTAAQQEAT